MMEQTRTYSRNPIAAVIAGLVIGLLLGMAIAWLWPVKFVNADPKSLHASWQEDFLRMAVVDYARTHDPSEAQTRYKALGDTGPALLAQINQAPGNLDPLVLTEFSGVVGNPQTPVVPGAETTPGAVTTPGAGVETPPAGGPPKPAATTEEGGGSLLSTILLCLLGIVVIALVGLFIFSRTPSGRIQIATLAQAAKEFIRLFLFPSRYKQTGATTSAQEAAEARRNVVMTDYASAGVEAPVAQFMASYRLGDDLFDDSFSIDSQAGEFLGECGVGISETVGGGDPKKVTAYEVWLFDKNDIQTVTKVLMSANAFKDGSLRSRLEVKGETVQAAPGAEFQLDTQTLTMVARVVDMDYTSDPSVPGQSAFDHLLLELAIWQKAA